MAPQLRFGGIFSRDPTQPVGTFVDAPRMALEEVAAHAELATNSEQIAYGAAFTFDYDPVSFDFGPVEKAADDGSPAHAACQSFLEERLDGKLVDLGGGASVRVAFDFEHDVRYMTCTPWDGKLHGVVVFEHQRLETLPARELVRGGARGRIFAMLTSQLPEGYTLWAAQCFVSIDGRLQNRVCISRDATHTSLLFRCNFMYLRR